MSLPDTIAVKAPPLRILAGGPTRETESAMFRLHREGLVAQSDDFDVAIEHRVVKDCGGPRWHGQKIERVARARHAMFALARMSTDIDDALLMVDTDVILGPGVLARMWEVEADVVYGVFWTRSDWGGSVADWPQVWDVNPYGWTQATADALRKPGVNEVEVLGGGACTLIRGRGFESRYWPLLRSIVRLPGMWGGEDRSYCLGLETRGIKQIAVTGLPIRHCYTISDQTKPALKRIRQEVGL